VSARVCVEGLLRVFFDAGLIVRRCDLAMRLRANTLRQSPTRCTAMRAAGQFCFVTQGSPLARVRGAATAAEAISARRRRAVCLAVEEAIVGVADGFFSLERLGAVLGVFQKCYNLHAYAWGLFVRV